MKRHIDPYINLNEIFENNTYKKISLKVFALSDKNKTTKPFIINNIQPNVKKISKNQLQNNINVKNAIITINIPNKKNKVIHNNDIIVKSEGINDLSIFILLKKIDKNQFLSFKTNDMCNREYCSSYEKYLFRTFKP